MNLTFGMHSCSILVDFDSVFSSESAKLYSWMFLLPAAFSTFICLNAQTALSVVDTVHQIFDFSCEVVFVDICLLLMNHFFLS